MVNQLVVGCAVLLSKLLILHGRIASESQSYKNKLSGKR